MTEQSVGSSGSKRKREPDSESAAPDFVMTIPGSGDIPLEISTVKSAVRGSQNKFRRMTEKQLALAIDIMQQVKQGRSVDQVEGEWNETAESFLELAKSLQGALPAKEQEEIRLQQLMKAYEIIGPTLSVALGKRTRLRRVDLTVPSVPAQPVIPRREVRLTPKDTSARPKVMYMAYTSGDEIGSAGSKQLIADMAAAGGELGFVVNVSITDTGPPLWSHGQPETVKLISLGKFEGLTAWAEDSGEFARNGDVLVPREVPADDADKSIRLGRRSRGYTLPEDKSTEAYLAAERIGTSVAQRSKWNEKIELAKKLERKSVILASHIEGGNLLTGADKSGNPFALVGHDAAAVTHPSDPDAKAIIARDIGVDPESVFLVEQPGHFHLDMAILIIGNGIVALNDSRKVYEVMAKHISEVRERFTWQNFEDAAQKAADLVFDDILLKLKTSLAESAKLEQKALQSLRQAGDRLDIRRIAGVFPPTSFTPRMNFLNGEIGSTDQGAGFLITNGGLSWAEDVAAAEYAAISEGLLRSIYFTDPVAASASLNNGGGIGCRVKSYSP